MAKLMISYRNNQNIYIIYEFSCEYSIKPNQIKSN